MRPNWCDVGLLISAAAGCDLGSSFGLFIVLYTGPTNQFVAPSLPRQCRGTLDGNSRPRGTGIVIVRICCRARALRAMAFCAGETGASVDDL